MTDTGHTLLRLLPAMTTMIEKAADSDERARLLDGILVALNEVADEFSAAKLAGDRELIDKARDDYRAVKQVYDTCEHHVDVIEGRA